MDDFKITFTENEKNLILEHTYTPAELSDRLKDAKIKGKYLTVYYSYDELDELIGSIASEFSHTEDEKISKSLDQLYEKLVDILDSAY
ncbi:MAG: hypothetical protein ACQEQS_00360 [Thermodesulfobacteriota bacterium]